MLDIFSNWLVDPSGLTPHGFCLLWEPWLIWTHALSDVAIGVAYFTIPAALAFLARRRRDLAFRPVFWLFAAFILLCGTGHWLDLLTLWVPAYGAQAAVKAATAAVSLATAALVWPLMPRALALPSPGRCGLSTRRCARARRGSAPISSARRCRCTSSTRRGASWRYPTVGWTCPATPGLEIATIIAVGRGFRACGGRAAGSYRRGDCA